MQKQKLFQYAILWHPTEKQAKEDSAKTKLIGEIKTVLAADIAAVNMMAAMAIPKEHEKELDQIEIAVRPF